MRNKRKLALKTSQTLRRLTPGLGWREMGEDWVTDMRGGLERQITPCCNNPTKGRYQSGGRAITAIKMRPTSELKRKRLSGAVGNKSQKRQLGVFVQLL